MNMKMKCSAQRFKDLVDAHIDSSSLYATKNEKGMRTAKAE